MKLAADTSVLVASFASWHEHHEVALEAIARLDVVVSHCLLETYSVLTRLPTPHRMAPSIVSQFLQLAFKDHAVIALSAAEQRALVPRCATHGIAGGMVYDGLIASTCMEHRVRLLTLDARARQTYAALGVDHELLA
ncbi:MAG: type II toxin-antitoxin system VapC family toxin [Deltaproteobacteria bacterium]|nr:type II toxin-antitoxin system VapC family toxin [Deltaproteobacteria bacterium]MDQ3298065.1 type II toxin-antitoxin system VapC family toxin [Myxococcota bacterium]